MALSAAEDRVKVLGLRLRDLLLGAFPPLLGFRQHLTGAAKNLPATGGSLVMAHSRDARSTRVPHRTNACDETQRPIRRGSAGEAGSIGPPVNGDRSQAA